MQELRPSPSGSCGIRCAAVRVEEKAWKCSRDIEEGKRSKWENTRVLRTGDQDENKRPHVLLSAPPQNSHGYFY